MAYEIDRSGIVAAAVGTASIILGVLAAVAYYYLGRGFSREANIYANLEYEYPAEPCDNRPAAVLRFGTPTQVQALRLFPCDAGIEVQLISDREHTLVVRDGYSATYRGLGGGVAEFSSGTPVSGDRNIDYGYSVQVPPGYSSITLKASRDCICSM